MQIGIRLKEDDYSEELIIGKIASIEYRDI